MSEVDFDDGYFDPEFDDNWTVCDRCNGDGTVNCYCAGDFCLCGAESDKPCPVCGGEFGTEGYITKELAEKRAKSQREFMERLRAANLKDGG